MIIKTITPDRSKILIEREDHLKFWTRHFGVTKDELARAIERVGNSAAAVRKQLSPLKGCLLLEGFAAVLIAAPSSPSGTIGSRAGCQKRQDVGRPCLWPRSRSSFLPRPGPHPTQLFAIPIKCPCRCVSVPAPGWELSSRAYRRPRRPRLPAHARFTKSSMTAFAFWRGGIPAGGVNRRAHETSPLQANRCTRRQ